ncbi:MAG TPA: thioredoxin family protein [Thermoanaerobaculia bacterium]
MREKRSSAPFHPMVGVVLLAALSLFVVVRSGETEASKKPAAKLARSGSTWHEGAAGFREAMKEAEADGLPVAVYFYTDWCPYCRQLNTELLAKPAVEEHFKRVVKVRINPEKGAAEREVANQYKVRGYPAFFVHPSAKGTAVQVQGQVREGNGWRVKTPEEFVATVRAAAGS